MKEGPFYKRREAIRLKNKSLLNNNCGYLLLLKWGRMVPFSFSHLFTFSQQKIGRARCLDCLHGISPQQAFNTHKLLLTHAIAHAIHISSIGTTIVFPIPKNISFVLSNHALLHHNIDKMCIPTTWIGASESFMPHCPPIPNITRSYCWKMKQVYQYSSLTAHCTSFSTFIAQHIIS